MAYIRPHISSSGKGLGWRRDLPDIRDCTDAHKAVTDILYKNKAIAKAKRAKAKPISKVDLRDKFTPVEDQGDLGSCTANAGVALFEYFQRNAKQEYLDGSRLFLYKATRELMGEIGDTGAELRTTMKAMALFGVVPEKFWPYKIKDFDLEPPSFCYAYGASYKAMKYYRLDPPKRSKPDVLDAIKTSLQGKLPVMFGTTVYTSFPALKDSDEIPYPAPHEKQDGGHAMVIAGYDDAKKIGAEKGALLIRNSWSEEWGDKGYGWLPYRYVLDGIATDFWTLVKAEFIGSALFE